MIIMTFIKANALRNVVWKLLSILFNIPWFTQASYSWRHYMEASLGYAGHVGLMVSCLLDNMFGHVMTLGNPGGEAPGKVNAPCWGTIRPVILPHYQRYDLPHREENDRSTICFRYFMDNFPPKLLKVLILSNKSYPVFHTDGKSVTEILHQLLLCWVPHHTILDCHMWNENSLKWIPWIRHTVWVLVWWMHFTHMFWGNFCHWHWAIHIIRVLVSVKQPLKIWNSAHTKTSPRSRSWWKLNKI